MTHTRCTHNCHVHTPNTRIGRFEFSLTEFGARGPNGRNTFHSYIDPHGEQTQEDKEYVLNCRKSVVLFVHRWVIAVRHAVFEDAVTVDFIEVRLVLGAPPPSYPNLYRMCTALRAERILQISAK